VKRKEGKLTDTRKSR